MRTEDVMYIQLSLFTVAKDPPKCPLSELAKYLLHAFVQASGWNYTQTPVCIRIALR